MVKAQLIPEYTESDYQRALTYIEKTDDPNACWNCTLKPKSTGYCRFWLNGRDLLMHRFICHVNNNNLNPTHLYACHRCPNNRRCCNPAHLYFGTPKENTRDAIVAGSHVSVKKKGKKLHTSSTKVSRI